ncbi:MAG TPA: YihY/virulence factor BrkB family protein [Arachidicoccus sp.]|nr:YihY/virulence factor BrkB family protein [Arachidicoccus sp.]
MTELETKILQSAPLRLLKRLLKAIRVPGARSVNFYEVVKLFVEQVNKEGLNVRAGAISFNLMIAIPACLLFLCTLIPYLPTSKMFYRELQQFVLSLTPNVGARALMLKFLEDIFGKTKNGLLSLGFIFAIFFSSNAMMGIIRTFDRSLKERAKTNFIKKRLRAMRLTMILFLLFLGTMIISMGQGLFFHRIMGLLDIHNLHVQQLIKNLRWIVIAALFFISISVIYKYAPTVDKRKRLLSLGSIIATCLLIVSTTLFSFWAQNFSNYSKFYGTIGSVLVIMMLIFVNSFVLLIGFELDLSIEALKEQHKNVSRTSNSLAQAKATSSTTQDDAGPQTDNPADALAG